MCPHARWRYSINLSFARMIIPDVLHCTVPPLPRELVVRGLGRAFLCLSVWAARFSIYLSICLSVHIKTPGGSISL